MGYHYDDTGKCLLLRDIIELGESINLDLEFGPLSGVTYAGLQMFKDSLQQDIAASWTDDELLLLKVKYETLGESLQ